MNEGLFCISLYYGFDVATNFIMGDVMKRVLKHVMVSEQTWTVNPDSENFWVAFTDVVNPIRYVFNQRNMSKEMYNKIDFNKEYVIEIECENHNVKKLLNIFEKI